MSKIATKALIDEKITGNGVQAITGPILNNVLNTMVDDYGTQDELSQLAQKVDELVEQLGIPVSLSAAGSVQGIIKAGETYYAFNKGNADCNISTRATPNGSVLDGPYTVRANGSTSFTATTDANYFRFSTAFTGVVMSESQLLSIINGIGERLDTLSDNTATALGKAINNAYAASNLFPIKAGETYVVFNNTSGAVNVSTRNTTGGAIIDGTYPVPANGSASFTATTDANYIRFSNTFAGYVFRSSGLLSFICDIKTGLDSKITQTNTRIDNVETSFNTKLRQKLDVKPGKNLFDKDSPLIRDNSVFDQDGTVKSDQYTIYWLISNPIDVTGHDGEKIICNKSYDTTTRYCCFEDAQGNKTTVLTSVSAYTIPANSVTAYILVYKTNGNINLNEVQIEFGAASSEYEPYNPVGGYFSEELTDETVFPPSPQPDMHETYPSINTAYIYGIFDSWAAKFPTYVVKTNLGRDASNTFDMNGYKIAFAANPVYKIMFICNQHGGSANGDPVMGAFVATQFINDICGSGHRHNDRLKWIRNNVEIYIIPAANPWGIDNHRRVNYNGVNLNRNWPTSGWDDEPTGQGTDDYKGASAADQPELQHYLQYISDVQPDIIIDNHTLGGVDGSADVNSGIMYIGFNKDAIEDSDAYSAYISELRPVMQKEYGITPIAYGHTTATTPDCRVWCSENDYYGGLIEMQWRDPLESEAGFTPNIIEASYMLCLSIYQYYATKE